MKLWDKGSVTDKDIENFTVGRDPELDLSLARFDVLGTLAHTTMLRSIDILTEQEFRQLKAELIRIYREITQDGFSIEEGIEDVHSQLEKMLTESLGDTAKKVHTGRSRNDQVLVDLHMFVRERIKETAGMCEQLFNTLCRLSEQHKDKLMPGYTHFQVAMPSSFGLWFASFAEDMTDDVIMLGAAYKLASQNPLGSAAGFGSSIPLNRQMTSDLLGFDTLHYNVIHAMMSRGKLEKVTSQAISVLAGTLSRLALDVCTYMGQNYEFITLAEEFTTGSSIMPHKKNPDVFELIRGKCNRLRSLAFEAELVITNLPSGYHRDFQVLKESLIPAFDVLLDCMKLANKVLNHIEVQDNILDGPAYRFITSVDKVNQLVTDGIPFREAYREIAKQIREGTFKPAEKLDHRHEGSMGNLCLPEIRKKMGTRIRSMEFGKVESAIQKLLEG
jgi:argininosuccinate lyase